jgi:hypothetical protein
VDILKEMEGIRDALVPAKERIDELELKLQSNPETRQAATHCAIESAQWRVEGALRSIQRELEVLSR